MLPRAEDAPDRADLGRNGSYLVMRQLRQDVHGFWQFVDRQARGDADVRERIASAMVGRRRDGVPLVGPADEMYEGARRSGDLNAFTYRSDRDGLRCPLGAHVRRSNPRNADLPPGAPGFSRGEAHPRPRRRRARAATWSHRRASIGCCAVVASTGRRVARNRRSRGAGGGAEPGLHFICLNANIARQFEFVQNAWAMGTHFAGLPDESDPLLGTRSPAPTAPPTDGFSVPRGDGPDERIAGLPQFVTVLGGAYFFLPGIRALRFLATAP